MLHWANQDLDGVSTFYKLNPLFNTISSFRCSDPSTRSGALFQVGREAGRVASLDEVALFLCRGWDHGNESQFYRLLRSLHCTLAISLRRLSRMQAMGNGISVMGECDAGWVGAWILEIATRFARK